MGSSDLFTIGMLLFQEQAEAEACSGTRAVIKETQRLDSYKDDMVQLIDMVCGAAMAEDRQYHRLIRRREAGRVVFPPDGK